MAMFWSKKSKAEKIRDTLPVSAKSAPQKSSKPVQATKTPKITKPIKAVAASPMAMTSTSSNGFSSAGVIMRPRITEKSGVLSQMGTYTFEVTKNANKNSISNAIKSLYKVVPVKVAILNNPARRVFVRGRKGVVPGVRKALVTLKKGDKIEFV
ncbi:MAG: ribosomal subunit protein large subunit ribosomal protein [Candidatus Parcubacteria bacterium]